MHPVPSSLSSLRACPDCGLISTLPAPESGYVTCCPRCGKSFRRTRFYSMSWTLISAITGLLFYWITIAAPLLQVSVFGRFRSDTLVTGIGDFGNQGFWFLAILVFMVAVMMPLLKLIGLLIVFGGLHLSRPPRWLPALFRELKHLNHWTMAEIYLLGLVVAYTRLQAMTYVDVQTAVYALIGLTLSLIVIDTVLDHESVWAHMQSLDLIPPADAPLTDEALQGCNVCHQANPMKRTCCLRCGGALHHRKPDSVHRAAALTLAAAILYIPANFYPVMYVTRFNKTEAYTILRGAKEFANAGLWPLAILIFSVSILIPALKLLMLGFMLLQTERRSGGFLETRVRMYRFVDFIGRWSMIDIFMLSVLIGLMRFGGLTHISAGEGATYFAAVVILNMLAVLSFDPRLMWDAAGQQSPEGATS